MQDPKRSKEPLVWLMFGAGTTVSAIVFPVLILAVGFLIPFGLISEQGLTNIYNFMHSWWGELIMLIILIFPVWGALHRIHHGLHDLKVHLQGSAAIFYGLAALFSIIAIFAVL